MYNAGVFSIFTELYNYHFYQILNLFYNFIYLFLAVLGICCCTSFSLVAESVGYSLVVVWASQCGGFSCCRAQARGVRAQ